MKLNESALILSSFENRL